MSTKDNEAFVEELRQMYELRLITLAQFKEMQRAHIKFSKVKGYPKTSESKSVEIQLEDIQNTDVPNTDTTKDKIVTQEKIRIQKELSVSKRSKPTMDVRNRNITVLLSIGVLMVIIAGIIFATSSWDYFSNGMRIMLISLFSVFFFGMSFIAGKKLKVQQSASAFWFLGTISIPVVVLAIGALGLLGQALTLNGEGRYWLLSLVGFVGIPINLYSCLKYKYKLYAWFTYIFFLAFSLFLLPAFQVTGYMSFLVICAVHALATTLVYILKNNSKYHILSKSYIDLAPFLIIISVITSMGMVNNDTVTSGLIASLISAIGLFLLTATYLLLSRMSEGKLLSTFSGVIAPLLFTLGIWFINYNGIDVNEYGLFICSYLLIVVVSFTKLMNDIPYKWLYGFLGAFNLFISWILIFDNGLYVLHFIVMVLIVGLLYSHYFHKEKLRILVAILIPLFTFMSSLILFYNVVGDYVFGDLMDLLPIGLTALYLTVQWAIIDYFNKRGNIPHKLLGIVNWGLVLFLQLLSLLWVGVLSIPDSSVLTLLLLVIGIFIYYLIKPIDIGHKNIIGGVCVYGLLITFFIEFYQWMNVMFIDLPIPFNEAIIYGFLLIILSAYILKGQWKKWIYYFGCGMTLLGLVYESVNVFSYEQTWLVLGLMLLMCIVLMITFYTYKITILNIIPLGIGFTMMTTYLGDMLYLAEEMHIMILLLAIWGLGFIGRRVPSTMPILRKYKLEWFTPMAFLLYFYTVFFAQFYMLLHIVTNLSLVALVGLQIKRFESLTYEKRLKSLTLVTMLVPLYTIFGYIEWPHLIVTEIYLIPIWGVVALLVHKIYKDKVQMKYLEQITFGLSCLILFTNIFGHEVSEGILFGMLMMVGCVIGFYRKERTYFIIATVFLTLDVIYFTWVFWVLIPWWGYLLIAGLLLLFFALYNEYKKSKKTEEKDMED